MKLIYAGSGISVKSHEDLLFNCTRNVKCQLPYHVPVKAYSDISFFVDMSAFPGFPSLTEIQIIDVCDSDNNETIVFDKYVIGVKPNGKFYGVYTTPLVTTFTGKNFYFKFIFTVDGVEYVFYSEQFVIPVCDELTKITACYPDETVGADAEDCNGIYYGFSTEDPLGDETLRFYHWAYVRLGSVIEQNNKLSFTLFNSKKAYKNNFYREFQFYFELVPTFYKNVLIGIFSRGNILIDESPFTLVEEQEIRILDEDTKLWRANILLQETCDLSFGCSDSNCVPPAPPCEDIEGVEGEVTLVEGVPTLTITGNGANFIEWEVYESPSLDLIDSGFGMAPDSLVISLPGVDLDNCYFWRWRVRCGTDPNFSYSDWSPNFEFGDCDGGGGGPTYYAYHCERFLCTDCAIPLDEIICGSTNPALTLFKYYKSQTTPTTIALRPIATSLGIPADIMLGPPKDTCFLSCSYELPPLG